MKFDVRGAIITIVLGVLAGIGGVGIGNALFSRAEREPTLHEVIHDELALTSDQEKAIEALEATFAVRRQALELEMRAANRELAAAIAEEQGYGPKVTAAVEHFHHAMGTMQTEFIAHVFAMREVLTPDQRKRFDETVVAALTKDT
ncbi:MAG: periplasmic heavy metal sensor [Alphaproteobacteria bacterium]|nr:periplasmic heavy metal sensor [Alphaproteobacteria bacterium]